MVAAAYISKAPEITIEHGVAKVRAVSEGKVLCWHLPVEEFRMAVQLAARVLERHDRVVPLRRQ